MPEYEDSDEIESEHSPDNEYGGLDVPIMRKPRAEKAHTKTSEPSYHSMWEKNVVNWFGYNDYMEYHYAFIMKMATSRKPKMFSKAANDPQWIEAMNE